MWNWNFVRFAMGINYSCAARNLNSHTRVWILFHLVCVAKVLIVCVRNKTRVSVSELTAPTNYKYSCSSPRRARHIVWPVNLHAQQSDIYCRTKHVYIMHIWMRLRRCNNVIYAHSFTVAAAPFVYTQLSRNEFLETNTAPAPCHWAANVIILWYLFIRPPHADEPVYIYLSRQSWMIIVPYVSL